MGVTVLSGTAVRELGPGRLVLADREIHAETILWAAGVEANPVARALGIELARGGRIPVGSDLALAGHPEVFAIGDIASCTDANGILVPGVAPAAMQMAKHVAVTIRDESQCAIALGDLCQLGQCRNRPVKAMQPAFRLLP